MIPYKELQLRARESKDRLAFVDADGGGQFSFGQLFDRVQRLAGALEQLGIKKGDAIAALLPNCIELVELYIACGALGAIFQPMDTRFRGVELQNCLTNTSVKVLFAWAGLIDQNVDCFVPKDTKKFAVRGAREGWSRYDDLLKSQPLKQPVTDIDQENDTAVYLYTSGSTATIKCVPVSWRQLDFFPQDLVSIWAINEQDRGLSLLPMSHISGPIVINLTLIAGGAYVMTNRFSVEQIAGLVKQFGITWTHTVPAIGRLVLRAANSIGGMDSLRLVALMGTTVPPVLFEQLMAALPKAAIVQGYGLTETSPLLTVQRPGWPKEKITSIGKALPHVEIKIVDENGNQVPDGQPGEIVVRGPRVFKGYVGNEALNRRVFRNGWFHTGDVGMRDQEGYYYHLGRLDDVIITGGLKVYPGEIENELIQHPAVSECVAYGEDDPSRGKVIAVDVVIRAGAQLNPAELRDFLSSRLATYKIPRIFRQVESLRYTPVGKPIRAPTKD